ncbi:Intramolecular chaperone auto-processing domain containing protein [uncultured Caudovirales phage]|uniref:Intramolecular chaperone auto-processing domain containing protein n=1 Tax=uncultured Caudovirales phage TaxID=2100421 RepID=A0A6J5MYR4_9CAUD|nr:Intramolecular chaperone auto-processing domain containing protein [uncultured Caudovirales phage]
MAYSYVRYTGNGSTTNYTFSFPTISTDHIKVRVNGTLVTNWSFLSASTVQFAAAPASGAIIEIRRETPKDSAIVNFTDGSVLLERDLDLLATYNLYVAQETDDSLEDAIAVTSTGKYNADGKQITNLANPDDPTDAVNLDYLQKNYGSNIGTITPVVTMRSYVYVATAGQTVFAGADANSNTMAFLSPYVVVSLNGLELRPTVDYALSGTGTITLVSGASVGDELQVQAFANFNVANVPSEDLAFTPAGAGAVVTTVQAKLRDVVNLNDFLSAAQKADIAAGTMSIDCSSAWNAAVASFPEQSTAALEGTAYSNAGTLILPPGSIYFASTRNIERNLHIRGGSGPDGNSFGATRLVFAANTNGLVVHRYNTGSSGKGGDGSIIENVSVITKSYAQSGSAIPTGTGSGIWLRARATIRNCTTAGFAEYGVKIIASAGVGGTDEGNANSWKIETLRTIQNRLDGLFVDGADANAGLAFAVDSSSNLGRGIYDSSFLGNTFVGCHTQSNGGAPYKTDNLNARTVFVGCYTEGGQPLSEVITPSMFIGGANDFADTGAGVSCGLNYVGLRIPDGSVTQPSIARAADPGTGFYGTSTGVLRFAQGGVERMRWASGGGTKSTIDGTYWSSAQNAHEFVTNSTTLQCSIDYMSSSAYAGIGKYIKTNTAGGTGFNFITAANSTVQCFLVLGNGNVQNTNNSYGAISDIKLKQDIVDASSQWADIKALAFKKYRFKSDPTGPMQLGVIAQELEIVSPGLVEEIADRNDQGELTGEMTKTVKYSVLTMKAVKALQEAMSRIELLEAQVAQLNAVKTAQ